MLNRMSAKSLRQQPVAPHSGSFLDCEAGKKARHCAGCRKSPLDFFDSLQEPEALLPALVFYVCRSSSAMLFLNWTANMPAVVHTARRSATGSAKNTANTLSAKKWGRI